MDNGAGRWLLATSMLTHPTKLLKSRLTVSCTNRSYQHVSDFAKDQVRFQPQFKYLYGDLASIRRLERFALGVATIAMHLRNEDDLRNTRGARNSVYD